MECYNLTELFISNIILGKKTAISNVSKIRLLGKQYETYKKAKLFYIKFGSFFSFYGL